MDKQPRMIDKDRLLTWLEEKATETGSWVEQVLLRNLVSEEIKKGTFDPIPLPTIKSGDTVMNLMYGAGKVEYKGKYMSEVLFNVGKGIGEVTLEVYNDSLELIPNE